MNLWSMVGTRRHAGGGLLVLVLALGTLGGCSLFTDEGPCTLIGCESGLMVRLDGAAAPATLRVHLPDGTVLERECLPQHCAQGAFFEGVKAPTAETRSSWTGTRRRCRCRSPIGRTIPTASAAATRAW